MAAARAGDAVASRIIATAADQAAGYVAATAARCELEGAFKIVLSGTRMYGGRENFCCSPPAHKPSSRTAEPAYLSPTLLLCASVRGDIGVTQLLALL